MIPGQHIDDAIEQVLLDAVTPMALEVTLTVQKELESRASEVERLASHQVERARYEAELSRRRFMKVDPDNRLVADELEAEWNRKLRSLADVQEDYERRRKSEETALDDQQRARILALSSDLPKLWNDPTTPDRERKRMVRLLIEDVTLTKSRPVVAQVRFRGGATTTLKVPPARSAWELRQTNPAVIAAIDELLDHHTEGKIATLLNERGYTTGTGKRFSPWTVCRLRTDYKLRTRYDRLRAAGMLDKSEIAKRLGVCHSTIKVWRAAGLLRHHAYNDKGECLFEPPDKDAPVKWRHQGKYRGRRAATSTPSNKRGAV